MEKIEKGVSSNINQKADTNTNIEAPQDVKTSKHAIRYFLVGVSLVIFQYIIYTIISNLIIKNNDFLWLSNFIASFITAILAYILHSKITWKEREIKRTAIYKFFIWNAILVFAINPGFTQLFSLFTPIYNLAYDIFQNLHINFDYEFVQSTGAFVFTGIVTMIMNFLFYDRFVFGKSKKSNTSKKEQK